MRTAAFFSDEQTATKWFNALSASDCSWARITQTENRRWCVCWSTEREPIKTPEERVVIKVSTPLSAHVELDGRGVFSCKRPTDAERYRLGLIQQLKDGVVK